MHKEKTKEEHKFTSTGIKFWKHPEQMNSYRKGTGKTIISTHISPTSICNLSCSYCSVKKRNRNFTIELDIIKDYVTKLKTRGLKAVILTGGGEPTIYPHFNELVRWLKEEQKLDIGLITNGTISEKVNDESWKSFSWIRVSINDFHNWETRIKIPSEKVNKDCVIGASFIYSGQNIETFKKVAKVARSFDAKYIRLLPDCLFSQEGLLKEHKKLEKIIKELNEPLFFHQFKIHGTPKDNICHQSYFRPYLSEVDGGTVYPCDSIVLNDNVENFARKWQLCKAGEVLDYLDGKIKAKFNPQKDCTGCVFTDNVDMLGGWQKTGKGRFDEFKDKKMKHENFP